MVHRQRIENVFARTDKLPYEDEVLRSDLARYLCILVAGFIERSLQTIYVEYSKGSASPNVARYVERQIQGGTNYRMEKLLGLVLSFNEDWANEIKNHGEFDRFKSAVDATYANRNQIAYGDDVGISYVYVKEYFATIVECIDLLVEQCER